MALTAETPVLERMALPDAWRNPESDEGRPLLRSRTTFPPHTFTHARKDASGRKLPQAIAHRGYKAKYPENTMGAFKGAVEVGAEAIETDIHLTKDGVVVLSHDPTLKRCFGIKDKVIDHDWEYISKLRTLREPRSPMPRLIDLLEYLAQPGLEEIWVLLDIKMDNKDDDVMRLIAETISKVPPSKNRPWHERIVLGIWAGKYLPLCRDYLPQFPTTYIGFSIFYASKFLAVPNVSFNIAQPVLMTPWGRRFIKKAHTLHRPVYAWTVNEAKKMRWDIRHDIDGVITDDPKLFISVRKEWPDGGGENLGVRAWSEVVFVNMLVLVLGWFFGARFKFASIDEKFKADEKDQLGA